jgi:hypothetical protein
MSEAFAGTSCGYAARAMRGVVRAIRHLRDGCRLHYGPRTARFRPSPPLPGARAWAGEPTEMTAPVSTLALAGGGEGGREAGWGGGWDGTPGSTPNAKAPHPAGSGGVSAQGMPHRLGPERKVVSPE